VKRRGFIAALVAGASTWMAALVFRPAPTWSQQSTTQLPRIGIIDHTTIWEPFDQQLRDLGDIDGQTASIEYRNGDGNPERLAAAASALVSLPVQVIATFGTPPALAARHATDTIPIIAISLGDPVRSGLVASLARPGANITGNTILGAEVAAKRLQLLHEALPDIRHVGLLSNPDNPSHIGVIEELAAAAPQMDLKFTNIGARNADELNAAFTAIRSAGLDALIVTADPVHQVNAGRIIAFLSASRLPAMFQTHDAVRAGALMCYGASQPDLFRRGATYVHKILHSTKPADLPVEQPVTFELVINLKTAQTLGVSFPQSFLLRADEVIE
jgi:putative ABC transport system substrate-binding protein